MWQTLREELHPSGIEFVSVALDTGGIAAAGKWIERAGAQHPSLVDEAHLLDELYGIVNVPMAVWIDETGTIVRPPEPAFPGRAVISDIVKADPPKDIDPYARDVLLEVRKMRFDSRGYVDALRDWVANGAASRFALAPEEVVRRSQPRSEDDARAAAHFEIGQHLWRAAHRDDAVPHFRAAHRLAPNNWTYKRQAWSFADRLQGPTDLYDGDWLSDVRKIGAENYYPPLDL